MLNTTGSNPYNKDMETNNEISVLPTLEQIESAYSGRPGKCCCGCNGKHYHADNTGDYRGGGKPNDVKQIKRILGILQAVPAKELEAFGDYVSAEVEGRLYIVYRRAA